MARDAEVTDGAGEPEAAAAFALAPLEDADCSSEKSCRALAAGSPATFACVGKVLVREDRKSGSSSIASDRSGFSWLAPADAEPPACDARTEGEAVSGGEEEGS